MLTSRTGISGKNAFTLFELIVTLFIISVITAIVLPSFAHFGERKLKSEAREIASILRYMNESAIARKETFLMKFNLDDNSVYWEGPDGNKTRRFDSMNGITTQTKGMVSRGELIVFFEPLGVQETIGVHVGRDNTDMVVALNHLSGRVTIHEK